MPALLRIVSAENKLYQTHESKSWNLFPKKDKLDNLENDHKALNEVNEKTLALAILTQADTDAALKQEGHLKVLYDVATVFALHALKDIALNEKEQELVKKTKLKTLLPLDKVLDTINNKFAAYPEETKNLIEVLKPEIRNAKLVESEENLIARKQLAAEKAHAEAEKIRSEAEAAALIAEQEFANTKIAEKVKSIKDHKLQASQESIELRKKHKQMQLDLAALIKVLADTRASASDKEQEKIAKDILKDGLLDRSSHKILELNKQIQILNNDINILEKNIQYQDLQRASTDQEYNAVAEENNDLRKDIENLLFLDEIRHAALEKMEKRSIATLQSLNSTKMMFSALSDKSAELQYENKCLNAELSTREQILIATEQQFLKLKHEFISSTEIEATLIEKLDNISRLNSKLKSENSKINSLLANTKKALEETSSEETRLTTLNNNYEASLGYLERQLNENRKFVKSLQEQLAATESKLPQSDEDASRESLSSALNSAKGEIDQLRSDNSELRRLNEQLRSKVEKVSLSKNSSTKFNKAREAYASIYNEPMIQKSNSNRPS